MRTHPRSQWREKHVHTEESDDAGNRKKKKEEEKKIKIGRRRKVIKRLYGQDEGDRNMAGVELMDRGCVEGMEE